MAGLWLLIQLGWRNLWRNARRNLILAVAVAIGVACLVVAVALLRGWQSDLQRDAVLAAGGYLKVLRPAYLDDPQARHAFPVPPALAASLDAAGVPWSARVALPAVVQSERETRGVQLLGVDPAFERAHAFLGAARIEGEALRGPDDDRVLLGAELAHRLQTRPGKRVVLTLNDADGNSHEIGMRVAGVFDAETDALEVGFALTGRGTLQRQIASTPKVTELVLELKDPSALAHWRDDLRTQLPGFAALDWTQLQPQLAAMLSLVDMALWIWIAILLTALSFGVANTLITAVLERARELGLMFVLGMRRGQILQQVLIESVLLVLLGLAMGLVFAGAWLLWLHDGVDLSRWSASTEMLGLHARMTPIVRVHDVGVVCALVLALGFLGALYPAWRAIRLNPLEALHGRKT